MENPKISAIKSISTENFNDTLKKLAAPIALAAMTVVAGCGGQVNSYSESDCPDCECPEASTGDAEVPDVDAATDEYMTRGELAIAMKEDVMGYTEIKPCNAPTFPDIDPVSSPELCDAVSLLQKRKGISGYPDGTFGANDNFNRAELVRLTGASMGLNGYPDICTAGIADLTGDDWFYTDTNALCMHGIPVTKEDGLMHPGESVTRSEWNTIANHLNAYLNPPADRITVAETVYGILLGQGSPAATECASQFSDIADNTMECGIINFLNEQGLVGTFNTEFRPHDLINRAEIAKLFFTAAGLEETGCTGCSGSPSESWYCPYADALCEKGFMEPGFMEGEKASMESSKRQVYKLAWDIQLDQNGY